jgi:hypothetical protein
MNTLPMSPDEFAARGRALYGDRWQAPLAADLEIADRTMRRWLTGELQIPAGVEESLRQILMDRLKQIGGFYGFVVDLPARAIFHYQTAAFIRIQDDGALHLLSDMRYLDQDERRLVMAGAEQALREEVERQTSSVVGRFGWGQGAKSEPRQN